MPTRFFQYTFLLLALPVIGYAQTPDDLTKRFQQYITIPAQDIEVPTVIEVALPELSTMRTQLFVLDTTTNQIVGSRYEKTFVVEPVPISVQVNGLERPNLVDQDPATSETFPVPAADSSMVELFVEGEDDFTASSLVLDLAENVALPVRIQVKAEVAGEEMIVLASSVPKRSLILFPETTASDWIITLEYVQPLRINELSFVQRDVQSQVENTVRFLAQPNRAYNIYLDPEIHVALPTVETGNLADDSEVISVERSSALISNETFEFADSDGDTVPDQIDNCVSIANPEQTDINDNERGDVCDDFDRDGIMNIDDNCQDQPNRNQADEDGDGIGDVCDEEESRVTEKYEWIPWVAMGGAITFFLLLFWIMTRRMSEQTSERPEREPMQKPRSDRSNL